MNSAKKAIIWREWKKGAPMSVICRLIEKPPATVFSYLRYHGGIETKDTSEAVVSVVYARAGRHL